MARSPGLGESEAHAGEQESRARPMLEQQPCRA